MKILTRDFGEIEIDTEGIITFCQPIYGFESLTKFVFLYDETVSKQFAWLQSLEDADVRFILVDPVAVKDPYEPQLSESVMELLGGETAEVMCWLVVVIPGEFKDSTVNLKSPIVVNPKSKIAVQAILDQDLPIRFPLFRHGEENGAC